MDETALSMAMTQKRSPVCNWNIDQKVIQKRGVESQSLTDEYYELWRFRASVFERQAASPATLFHQSWSLGCTVCTTKK